MTPTDLFFASTTIAIVGFSAHTMSARHNDLFVRRLSLVMWLVLGTLIALACQTIYSRWADVTLAIITASTMTAAGGEGVHAATTALKNWRIEQRAQRGRERAQREEQWESH